MECAQLDDLYFL